MTQTLTVCRVGTDWAVRDVTGTIYGKSPNFDEARATAARMAERVGGNVALSGEAKVELALRNPPARD